MEKRLSSLVFFLIVCGILVTIFASKARSQEVVTLARPYEPVVVSGSQLSIFKGEAIGPEDTDLFLYAYRSKDDIWEQIPFQFDERDAAGSYFNINGDETFGLDDNDELVFMAMDAGDENVISWIDDVDSQSSIRYKIKVIDPLTEDCGYLYLYRSKTLTFDQSLPDYVQYFSSQTGNVGQDRVLTISYDLLNDTNSFPDELMILPSAGGNGGNILDRLRMNASTSVADIDQTDITANVVQIVDGPVRVIKIVFATLKISIPIFPDIEIDFDIPPAFYYPYSVRIDIDIPNLDVDVSSARISFDPSREVDDNNMTFVSANNPAPGFIVDGNPDSPNTSVADFLPDDNWIYLNGAHGTFVNLFPAEKSISGEQTLYYRDEATDFWGDSGLDFTDGVVTPAKLRYRGYYLGSEHPSDIGAELARNERNPLQTTTTAEDFGAVPVELVSFSASVNGNSVHLTWVTATETNNFGFDVERKTEELDWQKIGFVAGNGTTSEPVSYDFTDANLAPGAYEYRLRQIDTNGDFEYSPTILASVGVPETFALHQNYPNPFNPETSIRYEIANPRGEAGPQATSLKIYDLLGREIITLVDEQQPPGSYTVTWNGRDKAGTPVASGVFIYRLVSATFVDTKKMVLVR